MGSHVKISNLRFEHHPTGFGIPVAKPRISWTIDSVKPDETENWTQHYYEVEIKCQTASDVEAFRVKGDSTVLVPWPAAPLGSGESAQVRLRSLGASDRGEQNTAWSEWVTIEAALLNRKDWTARVITLPDRNGEKHPDELPEGNRPLRFRKTFIVPEKAARARLYVTALGIYEAYLNGRRIGDECLAPGWTSYEHRIPFQVFDVGPFLQAGRNSLVIEAAEGWYSGRLTWLDGIYHLYGNQIGALAQLNLFDSAESTQPSFTVQTDETWECRLSPLVASSIYDGETYELGLEYEWLGSDQSAGWSSAKVIETPAASLLAAACAPVRVTAKVQPVSIKQDPDGKALVDFGQNLVGRIRIHHLAKPDKHRVVMRFAEVLEHDRLGTRPLRTAKATDTVIFGGGRQLEDWVARFTFHGFRYVEITGWGPDDAMPLTVDSLVAEVIHTDLERTGFFTCSDAKLNKLHANVVWSMRGNFVSIPTDCPQRDERLGWTGDLQVFSPTASYLYDCGGMLANWMDDLLSEQKHDGGVVPLVIPNPIKSGRLARVPQAVWDDIVILLPWTLYQRFGDIQVLKDSWGGMKSYLETLSRGEDGLWDPDLWQFADWLDPNAPPSNPGLARTDWTLVADSYLVYVASVMSKIAVVLGLPDESQHFQDESLRLKQLFGDKYVAKSGLIVADTQTALALALVFHLHATPAQRKVAADRLVKHVRYAEFKVSTGFAGTPIILDALTQSGHDDVAYRMLLEESCPSWLYPVNQGATTIWERWDSMLEDGSINPGWMTSFNHYALGSVANWMHSTIGGLSPLEPGWKKFSVSPTPGGTITSAAMKFRSPNGQICCEWKLGDDHTIELSVSVPPNATAAIQTPDGVVEKGSGTHIVSWQVSKKDWPPKPLKTEFRT